MEPTWMLRTPHVRLIELAFLVLAASGLQYHHLDGDPRTDPQRESPLAVTLLSPAPYLVENKEDRRAEHVAVLAQHVPGGRQLAGLQPQRGLAAVQDGTAAGVHSPEYAIPAGAWNDREAEWRQHVRHAPLDGATEKRRDLGRYAEVQAASPELHIQGTLCPWQRCLRSGRHVKDGALDRRRVAGADHGRAGTVAEQRRGDEGIEVVLVRAAEG